MNSIEIMNRGNEVLMRELGIEGLIEYLHSYGIGKGNYTEDRKKWLKNKKVEKLSEDIQAFKKNIDSH